MKKKILLSILLALTLLTALSAAACAEMLITLGSFPTGEELDIRLAETGLDAPLITADGVPEGLRVEVAPLDGFNILSLRGVPLRAGDCAIIIHAEEEIVCTLTLTPALPRVKLPEQILCSQGESVELRADATVPDGGALSYQWYVARGILSEGIEGATSPSYRPDTSTPGNYWYCCEVTNTNNGMTQSVMSDYCAVNVAEREIRSVSIESLPRKTDYLVGEELDVSGLRIVVRYEGGYNEILDEGFTVSPSKFTSAGTHSVTVSYEGRSCGFNVMVKNEQEAVTGIGVLTLPRKTQYVPGDNLETAGLSIRAYTQGGGHFDVSSGLDCSPTRLDREGEQVITVRYADKTCTFTVTVKDDKVVTGISVLTMPSMRTYTVGERLDTAGLSIMVNSNKGSEIVTEGFVVTPKVLAAPGTQEVTVLYGQYQTSFRVTVKERESATPTPRPTAGDAPSESDRPQPTPGGESSATASPVPTAALRKNTGVNTAVKVVFAIAVLALAGLAGYVWYLRRQGGFAALPEDEDEPVDEAEETEDDESARG